MTGEFGYAGKILRVDLSSASMTDVATHNYTDRFVGGRGIAAKIYWDEVPPEVNAFDPENRLIFITGPLGGLSGLAGSRWQICGKSSAAVPEHFWCSNAGGSWGAHLKFAGYDGIIIQGKSERPVYLLIQDGFSELRDASILWGQSSVEVQHLLKGELGSSVRVVATGPAGDNMVSMAILLAEEDSCSCGFGAVMGSKKLKAIAVRASGGRPMVANPERLRELTKYIRELKLERAMRFYNWPQWPLSDKKIKQQICYGCIDGCHRATYNAADGDKGKFFCQPAVFYRRRALSYYGEQNEVPFQAARLCNKYGLDTKAIEVIIDWISRCYKAGILAEENTGIPISKLGSLEFIETLVKKISLRDGFGDILAQGIHRAAHSVGSKAEEIITEYGPRMYITTGLFNAMEPRQPVAQLHAVSRPVIKWKNWVDGLEGAYMSGEVIRAIARRFWGSELAADFSTYEGKALAAKRIQDHTYAIDCLILCEKLWPIMDIEHSENHVGDPTIESRLYSAVTGNEVDEEGFCRIGERVFNLHRAILTREGHRGKEGDQLAEFEYTLPIETDAFNRQCQVPGKDGEPISRRGAVVDRGKFEKMRDEYYQLRDWDVSSGLQTKAKLEELNLEDIARDLEQKGLVV